jgi:ABC-type transport system substrate-binding protein
MIPMPYVVKEKHVRVLPIGLFLVSLALLSWANLVSSAETPKYGGRLVFGIRNDVSGLNPFLRTTSTNLYVRQLVYESLLDFDRRGKLIAGLAESWSMSADGKNYLFKLARTSNFTTVESSAPRT